MSNLVHNERLKLRATFTSNLGVALFIAMAVGPLMAAIAAGRTGQELLWGTVVLLIGGLGVAIGLNNWGRQILQELRE